MRFNIGGLCFTDAGAEGIPFHHDLSLVVLSYVIAVGGSFAALEMMERWRNARGATARYWQAASAAVFGGAIWSMHFIAMLALRIDIPITYAPGKTLLSLLIAIGAVAWGLQIVRSNTSWVRICCAGIFVGLGVAAMHYVGMAALRFPGSLAYKPTIWSLSLLVGIAAATIALWLSMTLKANWQRAAAALVMGLAICGMHYTGMASTVFEIDPLVQVAPGIASGSLAAAVALTTSALILCALVFVAADRRLLASAQQSNAQLARANAELEVSHQQFNAALDNMSQGLTFFDGDQKLIVCNRRYGELYRLTPAQTQPGTSLSEILDHRLANGSLPDLTRSDFLARREALSRAAKPYNVVEELRDGRTISMRYQPLANGSWVTTHEDVTEQRQAEARLIFMAGHDVLTQLPNRMLFRERLEQAINMAGRGSQSALLCLDLDHFKIVNDTLGHPVGDGLLQAAARRLKTCVREVDTVARLGGDEFAVIQLAADRPEDAELLANRIVTAFSKPFEVDGHQIHIGTSVGVALAPADAATSEKLLKNADIALYLAKSEGRGTIRFFEPEMDARMQLRRTLELDLQGAIARNEFEIYYQPLINLAADKIAGFEALLRWHHPDRGLILPADFIPLAEETEAIVAIGEWVLQTACFEAKKWPVSITVAINLSPVQFKKGDLTATVKAALEASGLRPDRLELEITETVLLDDTARTVAALHELRALGVAVALDDFGTGYSSLSYLRSFPFDKIKIDQSFVRDLVKNKESMSIVRAVTGLGHSLSMKTTAEGVETQEQLEKLRDEGCTEVQGYLFSRPRPASELPALIAKLQHQAHGGMRLSRSHRLA